MYLSPPFARIFSSLDYYGILPFLIFFLAFWLLVSFLLSPLKHRHPLRVCLGLFFLIKPSCFGCFFSSRGFSSHLNVDDPQICISSPNLCLSLQATLPATTYTPVLEVTRSMSGAHFSQSDFPLIHSSRALQPEGRTASPCCSPSAGGTTMLLATQGQNLRASLTYSTITGSRVTLMSESHCTSAAALSMSGPEHVREPHHVPTQPVSPLTEAPAWPGQRAGVTKDLWAFLPIDS